MDIFLSAFDEVPDHQADNARHDLCELLVVGFVAVFCGSTNCAEMAAFGRAKEHVFRGFKVKHAIPSHGTFSTVFRMIDPKALDAAFGWVLAGIAALLGDGDVIAIDGKALRGAARATRARLGGAERTDPDDGVGLCRPLAPDAGPRHGPCGRRQRRRTGGGDRSAWPVRAQGQGRDSRRGSHCNRRTVAAITKGGGDYCLALKASQDAALSDARSCFGKLSPDHPAVQKDEASHGRKETRTGKVISAKGFADHHDFPGLKALGRIESRRDTGGIVQIETRHFALSWTPAPDVFMATVRAHCETPNALHRQLEVSFREDAARNRKDNGPANIAIFRHRALDLARRDTFKWSLSIKLKRAGWSDAFLLSLVNQLSSAYDKRDWPVDSDSRISSTSFMLRKTYQYAPIIHLGA